MIADEMSEEERKKLENTIKNILSGNGATDAEFIPRRQYTFAEAVTEECGALLIWFTVAEDALVRDWTKKQDNPTQRAAVVLALRHHFDAMICELNRLVDSVLFAAYMHSLPGAPVNEQVKALRGAVIKRVDYFYSIDHTQLPRWEVVSENTDDANALKHRVGSIYEVFDPKTQRRATAKWVRDARPDYSIGLTRYDDIKEWCVALAQIVDNR